MAKNIIILKEPLEKKLWKTADKLRKNMDAAEYKHVVMWTKINANERPYKLKYR